jgi:hypothetical protein
MWRKLVNVVYSSRRVGEQRKETCLLTASIPEYVDMAHCSPYVVGIAVGPTPVLSFSFDFTKAAK